jgi:uncharacterized protein
MLFARFHALGAILASMVLVSCVHGAPATPGPALWIIEDADSRIYLFGTIHTLRQEDVWLTKQVERAFGASGELVLEVAQADDQAVITQLATQLGVDMNVDLSTRLEGECRADLDTALAAYGANQQGIERLRPWLAALSVAHMAFARSGYDVQFGVDFALNRFAQGSGMPISSIETAEDQMRRFAELEDAQQIAYLCSTLDGAPTLAAKLDTVREAWLRGDTATIGSELQSGFARSHPELYQSLFVERNQLMAAAIVERLRGAGTSFVAVGAGHLAGDDSIQVQLASLNVQTRRVR